MHNQSIKKTVVITGANRGIGLAMLKYYLDQGHHVIATCRELSGELLKLTKNSDLDVIDKVDITNQQSIDAMLNKIKPKTIDILINNAGQWCNDSLANFDLEQMMHNMKVNAFGSLAVTHALLPLVNDGAKIIMITSKMGSISDNQSGGRYGYRMSKAALNAAARSLSIDLKVEGISVAMIHPGWVKTDMGGESALIDAQSSVKGIAAVIDDLTLNNSGTFYNYDGQLIHW
ncbi:SDR family oxidoreductase [Thiotrichales bacterium 19S3-7]|nr:SDR family oxidoreductase [Thiotrichales bacterium 19S3-7]MCF6800891.1 SDR family oxidoreductase [Thiotrichales bacterium 19S3-11]